ncbi:MAG: hypothetical protein AMS25_08615 [Gemmatimonas sp. SM23_52]|nr:MAG: hypothetical protein AMS25_08615 [Gemmatimonas sp. SM23_52]
MKDATLGGYIREHERPPAFEGRDGDSYTVEIITELSDEGTWCAYLFFLRWEGDEPIGHVESEYLVEAATEAAVRAEVGKLTLHEVRRVLDGLVSG